MNSLNVIGRICNDIKVYENEEYKTVYFSIAVKRNKEVDDFIPCIAYNKTAEILLNHTEKGFNVGLSGRIEAYKTNVNGLDINSLRFRIFSVTLIESRKGSTIITDNEVNRTAHVQSNVEINENQEAINEILQNQHIDDEEHQYDDRLPF